MPKLFLSVVLLILFTCPVVFANESSVRLRGQVVYVPAYSHVFTGPRSSPYNLAITLVIRNSDPVQRISITNVDYYDHNGKLVRSYPVPPQGIGPLGSTHIHLEEQDVSGGFAPKFIVRWTASRPTLKPVIEALMIGATSGQGISFVSPAKTLQQW